MNKKLLIALCALLAALIAVTTSCANVNTANAATIECPSKAAYLIDSATGTVMYENGADKQLPIASMVKTMTLLVAFEDIENGKATYQDDVVVSERAAGMGGSQAFLDANAVYNMDELLKSIIVASANDSCVAIGEHLYGSVEGLVERMNEKATELGLENTHYVNCTGLPAEGQYSCAKDVAIVLKELTKFPKFFEHAGVWMYDFNHPGGRITSLTNTNKLVRFYEGCDGGKTGFTNEAGSCLAATAVRNDMRLVCVVIGASDSKARNKQVSELFNYGFANYESETVVTEGEELAVIPVSRSIKKEIAVKAATSYSIFGKKGAIPEVTVVIDASAVAPVKAGDKVGVANIMDGEKLLATVDVVAAEDAPAKRYFDIVNDMIKDFA